MSTAAAQGLRPDELPPRWTPRAFKDPKAAADTIFERPARTPCEAAWKVPAYRERVRAWLHSAGGRRLVLTAQMPRGDLRDAVFVRERRYAHGQWLEVAKDSLSMSVFAGRGLWAV